MASSWYGSALEVLVDTDIPIDVLRDVPGAIAHVQNLERSAVVAVSAVTVMELLIGCRDNNEQRAIERFVQRSRAVKEHPAVRAVPARLKRANLQNRPRAA